MLLTGCATDRLDLAPASYTEPWTPDVKAGGPLGGDNFSVPPNPVVAELAPSPAIKNDHAYSLPELIDIAQSQNPDTRIAWQQARQAALAVGMGEAIFLPMISASVIGGYQSTTTPLPYALGNEKDLTTTGSAGCPCPGITVAYL